MWEKKKNEKNVAIEWYRFFYKKDTVDKQKT